jgi:hypothetical protein
MSQYLSFELVNKANPEIKVDLGYWCTTIARGISLFDGIFRYTNDAIELDYVKMKSYIESLQIGLNEYKENLRKQQENKKENMELLLKAQTKVAVDAIKEDIQYDEEYIADWEDEIETWTMVKNKLMFILDVMEENSENWVLVYKNE